MSKSVMVFSHPNHEVALWASIREMRPTVIFLTDGGGRARMDQSRKGLGPLIDAGLVHFLAHTEASLYAALLRRDVSFFRGLAGQVARLAADADPEAIYCDSVEFYNPVHDISLPVVRAAFPGTGARVFEIPLIHQTSMSGERYELLRAPESLKAGAIWRDLSEGERQTKERDFITIYSLLIDQLGVKAVARAIDQCSREQVIPARSTLPEPVAGQVLRYEWRGALAKQRGDVDEIIGFRQHYQPVFHGLVA